MSADDDFYMLRYYHTHPNECVHVSTNSTCNFFFSLREVTMSGLGEQWKGSREDLYLRIFRLIAVSHIVVLSLGGH